MYDLPIIIYQPFHNGNLNTFKNNLMIEPKSYSIHFSTVQLWNSDNFDFQVLGWGVSVCMDIIGYGVVKAVC